MRPEHIAKRELCPFNDTEHVLCAASACSHWRWASKDKVRFFRTADMTTWGDLLDKAGAEAAGRAWDEGLRIGYCKRIVDMACKEES